MEKFAKKIAVLPVVLAVFLSGCATVVIPQYIKDDNPYKHKIYASFDEVSSAAKEVLDKTGWVVMSTTDPSVFERSKGVEGEDFRQVLLITDIRQTPLFIGSRYARLNLFIRSSEANVTEIEVRYITVSSMFFKSFYKYRNNAEVERIIKNIEKTLNGAVPPSL